MRAVEWSAVEEESKKNYSLLSSVDPYGNRWRMEFTPIADFRMCLDNETLSSFSFKLPMIPGSLLYDAYLFFSKVYALYGTEAALQLFYDVSDERYFWYVPYQTVLPGSVNFERNATLENDPAAWLVADIHSHGRFNAFFQQRTIQMKRGQGSSVSWVILVEISTFFCGQDPAESLPVSVLPVFLIKT